MAIIGVLAAITVPMSGNALRFLKVSGDARDLSNATAVAKMRAAAKFTQSRLYVDISGKTFYIQTFDKTVTVPCPTGCWVNEGGTDLAVVDGVVRLRPGDHAAGQHADHHRPGAAVHEHGRDARGDREHGVHHLQFPRHCRSMRPGSPIGDDADLHDRLDGGLRHHRRRDRVRPALAHQLHVDAVMESAVSRRLAREDGTTIIEVVISSAILVTLMAGLMSLAGLAISTTENQGHLAARTTEYAQDKMEQLLALSYGDNASDTTVFPAAISGGTGLADRRQRQPGHARRAIRGLPGSERQPVRFGVGPGGHAAVRGAGRHDSAHQLVLPARLGRSRSCPAPT